MLFNSYIFVLLFLPCALGSYYLLNHFHRYTSAKAILVLMSLWFYAYFNVSYLKIILLSVVLNFALSKLILHFRQKRRPACSKGTLAVGILANLALIFHYKYFNFFMENLSAFLHIDFSFRNILMPLGISFFTFQQISYLVDSYREETREYRFIDYCLFVTFFPQLIAGPIVMHDEMIPQFQDQKRKSFDQESFAVGLYCFAVGMAKKVLLADVLGGAVDWGFSNVSVLTAADTAIVALLYTFQLYFDFSGYCDMAYGIAKMFRIDLPFNFDSPYKSLSISDFWNRWHMTLGRFLRKYVYFPMGGSRKGEIRTWLNLFVVFLVSGIWHGADWTYILWGAAHGVARVLHRIFKKPWECLPKGIRWLVNFAFISFAWMLFRAESITDFGIMAGRLVKGSWNSINPEILNKFDILEFTYVEEHAAVLGRLAESVPWLHLGIMLALAGGLALIPKNCCRKSETLALTPVNAVCCTVLLVWSVISFAGVSTFLYFNF